ncbi:hydroxymyristoyl-ACP dehydratase [Aquimarina sp. U1-2]|uniref:3-hydroxyacyl-ACP dehydratase FabZ family protein n=1 Tax=Aquimarina sp. U1-2 TaxID=2823141 RepID=UPI001AEC8EB7|nr:FabA/FabZ family ACP-dehydratase [Aquimarina sp. U1-2]MBP2831916.1 hydroxymyristoyl-ACP dehydratase [Aquimarina sp. U1-2]
MIRTDIIAKLPYDKPFLFVDNILTLDDHHIVGNYTFLKDEYFYKGHFKNNPITPGVILTECMAQIGMACFGIYLLGDAWDETQWSVAMTSNEINFFAPVFPGEKVIVEAEKVYFRFNKLKCNVVMRNAKEVIVAKGVVAGIAFSNQKKL